MTQSFIYAHPPTLQLLRTKPWGRSWLLFASTHNQSLIKPVDSHPKMDPEVDRFSPPRLRPPLPPGKPRPSPTGTVITAFLLAPRLQPGPQGSGLFSTQQSEPHFYCRNPNRPHLSSKPTRTSHLTGHALTAAQALRLGVFGPQPHLLLISLTCLQLLSV